MQELDSYFSVGQEYMVLMNYVGIEVEKANWNVLCACGAKCESVHAKENKQNKENKACMVHLIILQYRGLFIPQVGGGSLHIPSA